jgi:hypothetical protein
MWSGWFKMGKKGGAGIAHAGITHAKVAKGAEVFLRGKRGVLSGLSVMLCFTHAKVAKVGKGFMM